MSSATCGGREGGGGRGRGAGGQGKGGREGEGGREGKGGSVIVKRTVILYVYKYVRR